MITRVKPKKPGFLLNLSATTKDLGEKPGF